MEIKLPKLKIVSEGIHAKDVKVFTDEGVDITKYLQGIDISIKGGRTNKVILTVLADMELECESQGVLPL